MSKPRRETLVLIVDDDKDVLNTLRRILERREYQVATCDGPLAALERLESYAADLVLSDLKMPEMNGLQFLYQVKRKRPSVPVILITGFGSVDSAVAAIQGGGFDYLQKPFEAKKIYEVVERALNADKPPQP